MKSLHTKIFTFFVVLLLIIQAISLFTLIDGTKSQEQQAINNKLSTAKTIFSELFDSRSEFLAAFAATVAKDYGIKQIFNDDPRSLIVALNNHRKRINADLAMTIAADGVITGQLLVYHQADGLSKVRSGKERNTLFRHEQWLEDQQQAYIYSVEDRYYQLSLSPLNVGSKTIGWLAFGFEIDQRLANEFTEITGLETDFLLQQSQKWQLIASSNVQAELAFSENILAGHIPEDYIGLGYFITDFSQEKFGVAMYGFRADFTEVLEKRWGQLLSLALLTLLFSLGGAYLIAASITRPIKKLVEQAKIVAKGDYNQEVEVKDKSELGQLAHEFNVMQSAVLIREKALNHSVSHDPLTNLPNRHKLLPLLDDLVGQKQHFGVLHLNLSRMKDVNDTLGHEVGDRVIQDFSQRLTELADISDVFHLGADEFILVTKRVAQVDLDAIVVQINLKLEKPCQYQSISLQLQARIGAAVYPGYCDGSKSLLQMADTALHHTRSKGQTFQLYNRSFDVNTVERLSLINDLKHAITGDQLVLHYQPKMNIEKRMVTHVEALVRWHHPELGMIPPDNFIYIAEQTGQINALTNWVFTTAMKQYKTWLNEGYDLGIAVNISAENLKDENFYQFIIDATKAQQVPTHKVTLEVTESAVVEDPESAITLLSQFKKQGYRISIDDYGTGYSSLAQLKQLPVHELKVDKSFVQQLKDDEDDRIIVRSTIELAHNMGLTVVAEGIEDEYALNWLGANQCELAQGYFISRPQTAQVLSQWFRENSDYSVSMVAE